MGGIVCGIPQDILWFGDIKVKQIIKDKARVSLPFCVGVKLMKVIWFL